MFSTLQTAVSGMGAAQVGLSTTGHNIANVGTRGYSRQRTVTSDVFYRTVSITGNGKYNQVGSGVNVTGIQQVRDIFLDKHYRREATKLSYFEIKTSVGQYVESISGEMEGEYSIQDSINALWDSMQEAVQYPESLDKRASLVSTATLFMDRMKTAWNDLQSYQNNLNNQVKQEVDKINSLTNQIKYINGEIIKAESNGDSANDLRDSLAVAIEDLNKIIPVRTEQRYNGQLDLFVNDMPLISDGLVTPIGLKYTDQNSGLVEPVFSAREDIIPFSEETGTPLFSLTRVDDKLENGSLFGLLVTRGIRSETYASTPIAPDPNDATMYPGGTHDPKYQKDYNQYLRDKFNVETCTIPKAMKQLDQIFNRVVTVLNDAIAPRDHNSATAPVGMDDEKTQFFEIFTRIGKSYQDTDGDGIAETFATTGRYRHADTDGDGILDTYIYNEEDKMDFAGDYPDRATLYSISNVQINPELLELDGYKKLPLSANGDLGNPDAVIDALDKWYDAAIVFDDGTAKYNISDGYNHVTSMLASEVASDAAAFEAQNILTTQIDNYRQAIMGVSSDEEMTNMLQFQRSYQASARVISIVDSMIDTIINGMI